MATLIIQRSSEYLNRFRNIEILVNGKPAGKVANGDTLQIDVPAGIHAVVARIDWATSNTVNLTATESEAYLFKLAGFRGARWFIPVGLLLTIGTWAIDYFLDVNISLFVSIPLLLLLVYILTVGRRKYLTLTLIPPTNSAAS
jgi:hypothetical protein